MESAEIDKELEELDTRIDQLRALYEQYFMGIERLEPQKPRQEVERRLKILRKEQIRNTAQRFKFNVLVQRMNTMQQYWGRVVREIENGTFKRDVIKAAARFGDQALAGLGKKRAKELAKVAAIQAQQKRPLDEEVELGADDLVEDFDEDEDEAPTPPKLGVVATPSGAGLLPTDLPVIQGMPAQAHYPQPSAPPAPPSAPAYAGSSALLPRAPAPAPSPPAPAPPPAASQSRSAGLRWGSSDPSSSVRQAPAARPRAGADAADAAAEVKRRVTEIAAELRAQHAQERGRGFGGLDLDFDDSPGPGRAEPTPTARPLSPAAAPTRSAPLVRPSAPAVVAAAHPPGPRASGFGVLDVPLDEAPSPPSTPSPSSPGSGIRTGMPRPPQQSATRSVDAARAQVGTPRGVPTPAASTPAPPARAPQASPGPDLGDQRLRQIYAKYVETKRSANESTAGVTYDKLAATLRAQTEKLKAQHPTKSIDFEVVVKDGKTHLKPVLR